MGASQTKKKKKNTGKLKGTVGPKVADVFFGENPGITRSIVKIPKVVHVGIFPKVSIHERIIENKEENESEMRERAINARLNDGIKEVEETKKVEEIKVTEKPIPEPIDLIEEIGEGDDKLVFCVPCIKPNSSENLSQEKIKNELEGWFEEEDQREKNIQEKIKTEKRNKRIGIVSHLHKRPAPQSSSVHIKTQIIHDHIKAEKVVKEYYKPVLKRSQKDLKFLESLAVDEASSLVAPPIPWKKFRNKTEEKKEKHEKVELKAAKKKSGKPSRRKIKIGEAARVAAGVFAIGLFINFLGSLNALPRLATLAGGTAQEGATHLVSGLKSIAAQDVSAGNQELYKASSLFSEAEEQINSSTSLFVRLAAQLDPKGRYSGSMKLLSAGQKLSGLGGDVSKVVSVFGADNKKSLTDALKESQPIIAHLDKELNDIDSEVKDISPESVPSSVAPDLEKLQGSVHGLAGLVTGYLNSHEVILELLGARQDRQYLFLFENNRELRPGGGFIGSFALVDVSKGEMRNIKVDTIYNPDGQLKENIIPPAPLKKITDRWFARDANWFADFPTNAQKVSNLFERSGGPTVDGVVAITPDILEKLMAITGPINMPQYDVTVTADNVVDETQRLVTFDYDKEKNTPKAFIADLVPEIMNRISKSSQEKWGGLVNVFTDSLKQKQILIWMRNDEAQKKVENLGWGGLVENSDGDYLMRVEANIGGHKTDELIDQSVDYEVSMGNDGSAIATVVTTRRHLGSKEGRPDWNPDEDWYRKTNVVYERTLVPKGSVLLEASGFTAEKDVPAPFDNQTDYSNFVQDPDVVALEGKATQHSSGTLVSEENGKTSFGNWVVTNPGETTVTVYKYRLPFKLTSENLMSTPYSYSLLIQKQPGHRPVKTKASIRLAPDFKTVWAGPEGGISYDGERQTTFTGISNADNVWGVVFERK